MRKKKTIAGLDVSGNLVTCVICSADDKTGISILGAASVASRGVIGGAISDLAEVAAAVSQAIEKSESAAHTKVFSLVVSCDGRSLRSYDTKGNITISEKENEVSRRDIERVTEAAKTIALPFDREIIHSIIRDFIIDGQGGIKDPSGMFGMRLEVDMEIVTGLVTQLHNLKKSINTAGFETESIVLSGIAAAQAVLEELEKDLGVISVHITYSSTHVVVYNAGRIKSVEVIDIGSGDFVELISDKFMMPREYAENILTREAVLDRSSIAQEDEIISKAGSSRCSIRKMDICDAIEPKAGELVQKISQALKRMAFAKEAVSGCVVSGELCDLSGFIETLELSLNMPVKMGTAKDVLNASGQSIRVTNPGQLVCLGLIKYQMQEKRDKKSHQKILSDTPAGKLFDRVRDIFSDYF